MNQNLIISENYPELVSLFLGHELYLVNEPKWYEELPSEGGNKFRFLNIVSHNHQEIIPPDNKDFFFRMANAIQTDRIKMDADGFCVINILDYPGLKWKNIEHLFSPKYCIFWGVDPHSFDINCKFYGGAMENECKITYVDSMDKVEADTASKKKLWDIIKRMFLINSNNK
ncbi:MAG: hypothetical protein IT245_05660 [Bacteroidia bacterium]|nr:hypothetical protein [Bacteroidia bacterium]